MKEIEFKHMSDLMRLVSDLKHEIWKIDQTRDSLIALKDKYQNMIMDMQDKELNLWLKA